MNSQDNIKGLFQKSRFFLKDNIRQLIDFSITDQRRGVPAPALQACDQLLGVDGDEEFTVYIAPIGKV